MVIFHSYVNVYQRVLEIHLFHPFFPWVQKWFTQVTPGDPGILDISGQGVVKGCRMGLKTCAWLDGRWCFLNAGKIIYDHLLGILDWWFSITLRWTYKKLLKMAIEIVDFPINSMVIFHGKMLVHQRVNIIQRCLISRGFHSWKTVRSPWGTSVTWPESSVASFFSVVPFYWLAKNGFTITKWIVIIPNSIVCDYIIVTQHVTINQPSFIKYIHSYISYVDGVDGWKIH